MLQGVVEGRGIKGHSGSKVRLSERERLQVIDTGEKLDRVKREGGKKTERKGKRELCKEDRKAKRELNRRGGK